MQVEGGGTQTAVELLVPRVPSFIQDIDKRITEVRGEHGAYLEDTLYTLRLLEEYLHYEVLNVSLATC